MRSLLINCWRKKNLTEPVSVFHISSTMKMENYGRLSPKPECSLHQKRNSKKNKLHNKLTNTLPGQVLDKYEDESDEDNISCEDLKNSSSEVLVDYSVDKNDCNTSYKQVGIQAGSPLGYEKKQTKTVLSISTDKQFSFKNPWKNPIKNMQNVQIVPEGKKTLAPIKKLTTIPVGKKIHSILQPVITSPTNKLPPVTKSFIRKLEKENIRNEEVPIQTINEVAKVDKNFHLLNNQQESHKDTLLLEEAIEDIPITQRFVRSHNKPTIKPKSIHSANKSPRPPTIAMGIDEVLKTERNTENVCDNLYNTDDLELMDTIEQEYI